MIDRHALAIVSILGGSLSVLGSLYLAYDLLGGEHGPLRTLTRGVTYGVIFGVGYGLALGPVFGLATGVTHGTAFGWELSRVARKRPKPGFWFDVTMSAIRGFGYALGAAFLFGAKFGITFGRSEEHTSELQSLTNLVCRLLLEKKKIYQNKVGTPL